jgi:hypothetical protein
MGYRERPDLDYTDASDTSVIQENYFEPSTVENIDTALFNGIKGLNIQAETNRGFKPVPVIWTSAERSYQAKHNRDLRDSDDQVILPVISIERSSFEKSLSRKGAVFGNALPNPGLRGEGGVVDIARRINQKKTANFANATSKRRYGQLNYKFKNDKVVYETFSIPLPIYIDVSYIIRLRSEYQQQANDLVSPFINLGLGVNYFRVWHQGHVYEAFVDSSFNANNNAASLGDEERIYETTVPIKVLGYLVGAGKNEAKPNIIRRENFVEVEMGRERPMVGAIPEHLDAPEKYRR